MINKLIAILLICGVSILLLGSLFYLTISQSRKRTISDAPQLTIIIGISISIFSLFMFFYLVL